jgi:hypothetical protein
MDVCEGKGKRVRNENGGVTLSATGSPLKVSIGRRESHSHVQRSAVSGHGHGRSRSRSVTVMNIRLLRSPESRRVTAPSHGCPESAISSPVNYQGWQRQDHVKITSMMKGQVPSVNS